MPVLLLRPYVRSAQKGSALLEDLTALMLPHGAEAKRMFGGTAFMLNGNLAIGTHRKTGLIVRALVVTPWQEALAHGGDAQMVMGERA